MAGRRAKPTKEKIIEGNPGKKRLNKLEPEPTPGVPDIPSWLEEFPVAAAQWDWNAAILDNMGVMTLADRDLLGNLCYLQHLVQQLAKELEVEGRVVYMQKMDSLGNEIMEARTNPKAKLFNDAVREVRQYAGLFGLDPSSRTRLSVTRKGQKSKFEGVVALPTLKKAAK